MPPGVDPPAMTQQQDSTKASLGLVFEPMQAVWPLLQLLWHKHTQAHGEVRYAQRGVQVAAQLDRVTTLDPMVSSYARTDYDASLEQAMNEQVRQTHIRECCSAGEH